MQQRDDVGCIYGVFMVHAVWTSCTAPDGGSVPRVGSSVPPVSLASWLCLLCGRIICCGRAKSGLVTGVMAQGSTSPGNAGHFAATASSTLSISSVNPGFYDALGEGAAELREINTNKVSTVYQGLPTGA